MKYILQYSKIPSQKDVFNFFPGMIPIEIIKIIPSGHTPLFRRLYQVETTSLR